MSYFLLGKYIKAIFTFVEKYDMVIPKETPLCLFFDTNADRVNRRGDVEFHYGKKRKISILLPYKGELANFVLSKFEIPKAKTVREGDIMNSTVLNDSLQHS